MELRACMNSTQGEASVCFKAAFILSCWISLQNKVRHGSEKALLPTLFENKHFFMVNTAMQAAGSLPIRWQQAKTVTTKALHLRTKELSLPLLSLLLRQRFVPVCIVAILPTHRIYATGPDRLPSKHADRLHDHGSPSVVDLHPYF